MRGLWRGGGCGGGGCGGRGLWIAGIVGVVVVIGGDVDYRDCGRRRGCGLPGLWTAAVWPVRAVEGEGSADR